MATSTIVESQTGGLESGLRRALKAIFDYVLKNLRFGRPGATEPSENFQANFVEGTTHSVAGTEFTVVHGRESAPYLAIPVLDLQTVGSRVVPLEVTKAADARRLYLKSTIASAAFTLYVEG